MNRCESSESFYSHSPSDHYPKLRINGVPRPAGFVEFGRGSMTGQYHPRMSRLLSIHRRRLLKIHKRVDGGILSDPITMSIKLLKIHERIYLGRVDGGFLRDHFMSLKHGLKFLKKFLYYSENEEIIQRRKHTVSYVMQKLDSLRYIGKDDNLVMNLERAYADLREEMKNVIIKPGTNEYDTIFPEIIARGGLYTWLSDFLCKRIDKLVSSDCKADQITPVMKELEDIRNMLKSLLGPLFTYAMYVCYKSGQCLTQLTVKEQEVFGTMTAVVGRAGCFIYLSFVGKMDDEMVFSLKNSFSDLIIKETQIMRMYLIIDIVSIDFHQLHISMLLRLLEWNKKCYLGTEMQARLEDHFMSIEHGLQFLILVLKLSTNNDLKLRIQHLVSIGKHKLYSLPQYQEDENLIVKLEHAYDELREEMQNVVIKPGSDDYDMLFPEILKENSCFATTNNFLVEKIGVLVTSSCKADQIAPVMTELEKLRKKLTSMHPLFEKILVLSSSLTKDEEKVVAALTTFLDRATCLIYLSFIRKLDDDMLVSLRKYFSLLIGEFEIKEIFLVQGCNFNDEMKSDIDISRSLLKRLEEYQINGAMFEDHILSLKHGIEFLASIITIFIDDDLKRRVILLARNVKQKLERLTYIQESESLNMDMNGAYADLREDMKNLIINPSIDKYDILFPEFSTTIFDLRETNDFLLEKITTLLTSNCKANQIAPLKKELQDLRKMVAFLKPLLGYEVTDFLNFFTIHHKATLLIYLSLVGKMDLEMMLLVKSNISIAIEEIDILEIYTVILNDKLDIGMVDYLEEDLYLVENLILLLKCNVESLSDANSKLYEALIDIHVILLGLSPNVFLRKLHLLKSLSHDILRHSIPIICSCYIEEIEVDISVELNCVLDLIKHIKFEVQEIKVYYFPRGDDLGFMEFFLGHLEDLMKNQELSIKEEIIALHFEFHSLVSFAKVRNQELNETPWTDIINLAYQSEYITDLYLASRSGDLGLISSLSKIVEQLKNIRADMNDVLNWDLSDLCKSLPAQDVAVTSKTQVHGTPTQVSDNDAIVCLQEESKIVMEHLLKGENKLDVISIIGMGGVGKTTLALTIYKTPSVADQFDILAWCTISQSYQNRELLLAILDQVHAFYKNHRSISDDQELADHLCRSLRKRRFLIVLDDIWATTFWNYLKRYLPDDSNGSRILITTRNKDVADQIRSKVDELHGLSKENSWELFLKKMIDKESLSDDLLKCSKRIVDHCKGLPLSIVIIAGILSDIERTKSKWDEIAKSVSSLVLSDTQGKCKAILELSYNHLPNRLRSCFLYLGSFPEDQGISVKEVTMRWIGEGLIQGTQSDSPEEVAKKYVEDLIVKSLVIPARERSQGGVKTFRLHDLLRDFCLNKAKEMHFFSVLDIRDLYRPLQDPRRLIINRSHIDKNLHLFSCHNIRSLISYGELGTSGIEKRIGSYDMVLLKVLVVCQVGDLFPNISSLVHLQYLALCLLRSKISALPDSISKLHNLQVLILNFDYVIKVPDYIWDMVKVRHVHISPGASFEVDSNRLENSSFLLENLRSLSTAYISWGDSKWLSKLSGLQRLSCIFREQKEDDDLDEYDDLVDDLVEDNHREDDDLELDKDDDDLDDSLEKDDDLKEDGDPKEDTDLEADEEENEFEQDEDEKDNDLEEDEQDVDIEQDDDLKEDVFLEGDDYHKEDVEGDAPKEDDKDEKDNDFEDNDDDDDDKEEGVEGNYLEEDVVDDDLEDNKFQMLRFNSHLTSLKMDNEGFLSVLKRPRRFIGTCQLPISLQKLTLSRFYLKSNDLSQIGRALPHLEVLKIRGGIYIPSRYKWNVDDEDFPKLKVLKLAYLDISKLIVAENSFPNLEQLWVESCKYLDEIPLDFGYLLKLLLISVKECLPSVDHSAREIEKIQHEEQNTEMKVHIYPRRWYPWMPGANYFNR